MSDRDLNLWMNERWYNALAEHLGGEDKLRQRLDNMLDDLINILPDSVCAKISREIQEEQRRWEAEMEEVLVKTRGSIAPSRGPQRPATRVASRALLVFTAGVTFSARGSLLG